MRCSRTHLGRLSLNYWLWSLDWLLNDPLFYILLLRQLLLHASEVFKYFYQHLLLLFNVCLVGVSHKLHVYFAALLLQGIGLVLLFKVVEVFVWNLRLHFRLVRSFPLSQICPVKSIKKRMRLNLIGAVSTQTHFRISYHLMDQVGGIGA